MTPPFRLQAIDGQDPAHVSHAATLWNAACGDEMAVSPRFITYNLHPGGGVRQAAMLALVGDAPAGFVVASMLPDNPAVASPEQGWIDALVVAPDYRRQGVGSRLLTWAEGWLLGQGCRTIRLGGSLRPFVPGVPVELETAAFFVRHGYGGETPDAAPTAVWDVAADLALYTPPRSVRDIAGQVRPATPADHAALAAFLQREFPGRWHYEFEQYVAAGGRIADYMVLWTARGVDGCCILTFPDSLHPIERFYPYRLPAPGANSAPSASAPTAAAAAMAAPCSTRGCDGCTTPASTAASSIGRTCWTSTPSSVSRPIATICNSSSSSSRLH